MFLPASSCVAIVVVQFVPFYIQFVCRLLLSIDWLIGWWAKLQGKLDEDSTWRIRLSMFRTPAYFTISDKHRRYFRQKDAKKTTTSDSINFASSGLPMPRSSPQRGSGAKKR